MNTLMLAICKWLRERDDQKKDGSMVMPDWRRYNCNGQQLHNNFTLYRMRTVRMRTSQNILQETTIQKKKRLFLSDHNGKTEIFKQKKSSLWPKR